MRVSVKLCLGLLFMLLVLAATPIPIAASYSEGWTAFNDFAQNVSGAGSNPSLVTNYTTQTGYINNGSLKNFGTGETLSVNLSVIKPPWLSGYDWDSLGGMTNPGTDAYNIFYGRVNASGMFCYANGDHLFNFTGLNSSKRYRVVLFANREGGYTTRNSTVIIQGADSFKADSSSGVKINTTIMANDSATYTTGENTVNGYVASWTNISSGVDGSFFINVTKVDAYGSAYQYSNAIMLQELPEIPEGAFTVVVIPDPQDYLKDGYPFQYQREMQWIVDNKDYLNIQFVMGVGDIIENEGTTAEWGNASKYWKILDDAGIPNSVLPGNHEHVGYGHEHTYDGNDNNISANFDTYFNVSRYNSTSWWGGNYINLTNSYYLLTIGGEDYIFLSLGWCPTQAEIGWADSIFTTYSDRKGIFATHGYLDETTNSTQGAGAIHTGVNSCDRYSVAPNYGNTTYIWNMIKKHPNVQVVVAGHEHETSPDNGERRRTDLNDYGKPVHQMLADYQDYSNGGEGYIRLLIFVPSENKIYVNTTSTNLLSYKTGYESQFTLDYVFDIISPNITINAPTNGSYWNTGLTINGTCFDANLHTAYTNSSYFTGIDNTPSIFNFTNTSTLAEGAYTIMVSCNDSANNTNSSWVSFTFDSIKPSISLTFPSNNSYLPRKNINITGTASDTNPDKVVINNTIFGSNAGTYSIWNFTNTTMNDGFYYVLVTANDSAGNSNSTSVYFTIDTVYPTITIDAPTNGSYWNSTSGITINGTCSDVHLDRAYTNSTYFTGIDNTPSVFNFTNTTTLIEGSYTILVSCNDSANNTNSSSVGFTFDITPPIISALARDPSGCVEQGESLSFSWVQSDNIGIGESHCSITNPSGTVYNITAPSGSGTVSCSSSIIVDETGTWTATIYSKDDAGNIGSKSISFRVKEEDECAPVLPVPAPPSFAEQIKEFLTSKSGQLLMLIILIIIIGAIIMVVILLGKLRGRRQAGYG